MGDDEALSACLPGKKPRHFALAHGATRRRVPVRPHMCRTIAAAFGRCAKCLQSYSSITSVEGGADKEGAECEKQKICSFAQENAKVIFS